MLPRAKFCIRGRVVYVLFTKIERWRNFVEEITSVGGQDMFVEEDWVRRLLIGNYAKLFE